MTCDENVNDVVARVLKLKPAVCPGFSLRRKAKEIRGKQIARNNQNHSQPSRSRDRRVEPCSRTISGEESRLEREFSGNVSSCSLLS